MVNTQPIESEEDRQVVRQLAFIWAQVDLPSQRISYTDYVNIIAGLHAITSDADRTTNIVMAVINQAASLGRSSEWVETELKFEAQAETLGDRTKCLLLEVKKQGANDAALDRYNERLNRFKTNG